MVDRPLADRRPVGPILNLDNIGQSGKSVIGVPGTPFPDRGKNPIVITFLLEGMHQAFIRQDVRGTLGDKIEDKMDLSGVLGGVDAKESGSSSAVPFQNQAVIVTVPGEGLPIQESEINRVINTIERHYDNETTVQTFIIDQE